MEYKTAENLLKAIKEFDRACEGDSNDAEHAAAVEMKEAATSFLRASASRDVTLGEMLDRELQNHPQSLCASKKALVHRAL